MKPLKRITILLVIVSAIVVFWLAPGINTAGDVKYTRRYEDTDKPQPITPDTTGRQISARQKTDTPVQTKAYKKESIESGEKLSKINASMFSRAIHFEEEIVLDSVEQIELVVVADTIQQIQ